MFKKIYLYIQTFVFIAFLYSGLMKWIPGIPFDLTAFFGGACILILLLDIITQKTKYYSYRFTTLFTVFFLFFWILVSCSYTISQHYYQYKLLQFFLVVVAIVYPLIIFKNENHIKVLLNIMTTIGVIALILVIVLYVSTSGDLRIYYTLADAHKFGSRALPDYLAIGELLMTTFLINQRRNNLFFIVLKIFCFLEMVWLAGRGPIIGLVLLLIFDFLLNFKFNFKSLFLVGTILIVLPISGTILLNWEGSEILQSRLEGSTDKSNHGVSSRLYMYEAVFNMIEEKPFLGTGFGSFGTYLYHKDMRAYPHNMFLELFCETGIIGFLILLFLMIYYLFFPLRQTIRNTDYKGGIYFGFTLVSIALLMQTLKASPISDIRTTFGFMGTVVSAWYIVSKQQKLDDYNN